MNGIELIEETARSIGLFKGSTGWGPCPECRRFAIRFYGRGDVGLFVCDDCGAGGHAGILRRLVAAARAARAAKAG